MPSIGYIARMVGELTGRHATRDPYGLCESLGVRVRLKDLGSGIKAYYFCQSRIRNIVVNTRVPEAVRRVLVAHELGHDMLHREMATLRGFQEVGLFDTAVPAEYEANIFAAEVLIEDGRLLELLSDRDRSFFGVARELYVPAALLDFKLRVLKHKGHRIEAPYIAHGGFLKDDMGGCCGSADGGY